MLEIWPVLLVEPTAKENRPQELLSLVLAEEADGRRVVVNLAKLHLENPHCFEGHLGDQAAAVCLVQEIQRLGESFVVKATEVVFGQPEELGYVATQLVVAAADTVKGEVSDRAKFRDAIRAAATNIHPPRGPIRFDRYQQVITDIYVMKVERQGARLVNAIVDRIPNTSQEESWKWWNKP